MTKNLRTGIGLEPNHPDGFLANGGECVTVGWVGGNSAAGMAKTKEVLERELSWREKQDIHHVHRPNTAQRNKRSSRGGVNR